MCSTAVPLHLSMLALHYSSLENHYTHNPLSAMCCLLHLRTEKGHATIQQRLKALLTSSNPYEWFDNNEHLFDFNWKRKFKFMENYVIGVDERSGIRYYVAVPSRRTLSLDSNEVENVAQVIEANCGRIKKERNGMLHYTVLLIKKLSANRISKCADCMGGVRVYFTLVGLSSSSQF
ncbi:hypothetical protein COOONC_16328 [Cooperia oncophora]